MGYKKNEKPYTTGEVASMSHVTINAVKKWINSGKLPAFRTPGGHFRINREDFREFIDKFKFKLREELLNDKSKVLITDDEPQILEFITDALIAKDKDEFEIETASDGYEALIKVGEFMPDLLIIDIRMPRIDGIEVCKRLRKQESTKNIKILAITAFGQEEKGNVLAAGADQCLLKPLRLDELHRAVDRLLK